MAQAEIKIISKFPLIAISKIKKDPNNVKKHPEGQILKLMDLIRRDGFDRPVAINNKWELKGGHGRLLAAERLGMTKVPYRDISHLSPEEQARYMIEDNLINESPWDVDKLREALQKMDKRQFGGHFLKILKKLSPASFKIGIEEDEPPAPRPSTKIKPGDVFQLGRHRLMCGDCTDKEEVTKLMNSITVAQIVTDPPYGVGYGQKQQFLQEQSIKQVGHKHKRIETPIENDSNADYRELFASFLKLVPLQDYNTIYSFMSGQELHTMRLAFDDAKIKWGDYLVWRKNAPVFGRKDYHASHEFIIYGWKGKHKFYGPANSQTVIDYDRPLKSNLHPTMKPVGLLAMLIQNGSKKDDVVYDAFAGSGSTLMACEQTDRTCYSMEKDPIYCQVIIDRWEAAIGKKVTKAQ